ncbi:Hypothetical protein D9617_1g087380 [Elsinoe fawcettii]|nr:Hypothetical protein D9617_1g087380 [Elsinoe fawcettii]
MTTTTTATPVTTTSTTTTSTTTSTTSTTTSTTTTTTTASTRTTTTSTTTTTTMTSTGPTPTHFKIAAYMSTSSDKLWLTSRTDEASGDFLFWDPTNTAANASQLYMVPASSSLALISEDGSTTQFSQSYADTEVLRFKPSRATDGGVVLRKVPAGTLPAVTVGKTAIVKKGSATQMDPWALCETDMTQAGAMVVKYLPVNLMDGCRRVVLTVEYSA